MHTRTHISEHDRSEGTCCGDVTARHAEVVGNLDGIIPTESHGKIAIQSDPPHEIPVLGSFPGPA